MNPTSYDTIMDRFYTGPRVLEMVIEEASRETPPNQPNSSAFCVLQNVQENDIRKKNDTVIRFNDNNGSSSCPYVRTVELHQHLSTSPQPQHQSSNHLTSCSERSADEICDGVETGATIRVLLEDTGKQKIGAQREEKAASVQIHHSTHLTSNKNNEVHVTRTKRSVSSDALEQFIDNFLIIPSASTRAEANENEKVETATPVRKIRPRDVIDSKIEAVSAAVLTKAIETNGTSSAIGLDVVRQYALLNPFVSNQGSDMAQTISATAPVPSGQKALRERTSLSSCFGKATTLQKDPDDGRVESTTTTAIYPPYPQVHGAQFINTNPVNLDGLSKVQIAIYHLHQQGGGRVPPLSTVTSAAGSVKTGHDPLPSTMFPFPDIPRPKKTILGSLSTSVSVSAVGSSTTPNRLLADNSKDSPNITSLAPMEPQLLCVKVPNPLDIRRRPPGNDKSYKALISLYEQSFYQTRELALANRQYYMTGSVGSSGVIPSLTHCVIAIDKPRNQDHFTSSFSGNHGPGDEGRKMFNIISVRGGGSCNNAVTSKERLDNGTSQNVEDPKQQNHAESSCVSIGGDILAFMKNVPHVDKRNLYVMVDPYLPVNPFFDIDCSKWSFHHQPRQGEGTQLTVSLLEKLQHAVNTSLIIPLLQSEITHKYTQECTELLGWLILECLTASLEAYFSTPLLPEDVPDGQPSQVLCNVSRVSLLTSSVVIPCKGTPFGGDKDVKLSLHAHFTLLLKRGFSDSFPVFFKNIAEHKIFTCEFLAINPAAKDILEFDPSQAAVNGSAPNGPNTRIVEVLRRIASSIIELQISAAEGKETKMGSATPQAHDVVRVLYNQALATTVDFILPGSEEQDNAAMSLDECKERLTIIYSRLLHELLCTVIDASIYTKWRPFRLPYNTKMVDFGQCFDSTVEREEFNNGDDCTNLIQVLENENNCEVVNQEAKAASAASGGTNPGCVARSRYSISALTVLEQQFDEEVIKYHQKSRVMEGVPQQNNLIVFANSILDSGILCENHRNDKDECDLSCNNVHDKNADRSIVGRFLLPISPIYSFSTPHPEGGGRNLLCSFLLKYGNNCEQILGVDQQYFHQTVIEDALIHPYRYTGAVQHLMQCPDESKVQNSEFLHFYHSAFHHYTRSRLYKNIICCPLRNRYLRLINEVKSVIIAVPVDDSEIERIRQAMASLRRECTALLSDIEPSILKKQHEIVKRTMDDIDSLLGAEKTGSKRPRIEESIDGEVSVALVTPLQQLISLMTKDRSGKGDGEKEELKRLDNILNFDFSGNSDPMKKKTNGIPERRTGEMSYFLCPFGVPPIVSMVVLRECFTDKTDLSVSPADMQTQMSTRWQEFLVRVLEIFFDSTAVTSMASSGDGAAQMVTGPYIPRTPFGSGRRVVINDLCIRELLAEVFRCLHPQFGHAGSKVISAKTLTKCEYEDNGTSRGYYVCQKTNNFCMKLHRFHKSTFGQLYLTYGSIKYRCYSNDCCYRCLCIPWCGNNMGNNELEEGNGGSSYYPDHRQLLYLRDLLFPNLFPETPEK